MTLIKRLAIILFAVIFLASCGTAPNEIEVTGDIPGVEKLYESEYSFDKDAEPYFVSNVNDKLSLSNKRGDPKYSHVMPGDNGYFVGITIGEFDGWVRYYPYYSFDPLMTGQERVICEENCRGFIKIDNKNAYMFTGLVNMGYEYGKVYKLNYSNETGWTSNLIFEGDSEVIESVYSNGTAYFITYNNLYSISDDDKISEPLLDVSQYSLTSITALDGVIYVGTFGGVLGYNQSTGDVTFYTPTK